MSKIHSSPTASLLRSSRLFSLPKPIKPRRLKLNITAFARGSDTATQHYPTHQAIATPPSSLARGDWGLKRALPQKSFAGSSEPSVQVLMLDTIDQITDFLSAAPYTRTLQKWQDMNVPLTGGRKGVSSTHGDGTSVFEEAIDKTTPLDDVRETDPSRREAPEAVVTTPTSTRWKFAGPWVAGMSEGKFQEYVATTVQARKAEFKEYLRKYIDEKIMTERIRVARDEGRLGADGDSSAIDAEITEEERMQWLRILRSDLHLSSNLFRLIGIFLDLPDTRGQSNATAGASLGNNSPPTTHPSAGLSYLRSSAFLENHPILGPMQHHAPIQARVLTPKSTHLVSANYAKIGVAGFVTEHQGTGTGSPPVPGVLNSDFDTPGGAKVWVRVSHAHVNSNGEIVVDVKNPSDVEVGIRNGKLVDTPTRRTPFIKPLSPSHSWGSLAQIPNRMDRLDSSSGPPGGLGYGLTNSPPKSI